MNIDAAGCGWIWKTLSDPIGPTGEQSAAMIPDNRFIRYEGAPHGFFYTEKEKLNEDLLAFINEAVLTGVPSR